MKPFVPALFMVIVAMSACRGGDVVLSPGEQLELDADAAYLALDLEAASEKYQLALQTGSETTKLHNNLGNTLFRQQRYNAAEQSYKKALVLDPEYLFSLNNLVLTLYSAGEEDEARRLLTEARRAFPRISFLHTTEGYFDYIEGNVESARRRFKEAIDINPDSPAALNNLGMLFLENPALGQDPLPYLLRALEKDGGNKLFHDSLGWYYFKKGMFAEATIEIGKAFAYDPEKIEIRVHYATVLEWIGKDEEALEQWEQVLRLAVDRATRNLAQERAWEIRGRGVGKEKSG